MLDLRSIAKALGGEVSGMQVLAPGPGHSPEDRSLSIRLDPTDPNDFICHSHARDEWKRCRDYIKEKIGLDPFKPNGKARTEQGNKRVVEKIYRYPDENGELLFEVVRFRPKGFCQRRPNGKDGHAYKLDGVRRVPYRLPKVLEAAKRGETIYITEGEKAADALAELGLVATCSPGGAGKWRAEYATHFGGAGDVVILPDNDEVGKTHARDIKRSIPTARILRLRDLPKGGDVFDWIVAGGTADQLRKLAENADDSINEDGASEKAGDSASGPHLVMRCAADIEPEPIDWIWEGRIARGKLTVIGGDPEEGKSQLGVYIAARISMGSVWANDEGRAPRGSIIVLSAEDGAEDTLIPRLIAAGADRSKIHLLEAVRQEDDKGRRTFNLQTDLELLSHKIDQLGDVQAVIIDPASAYMGKNVDSHNDQAVRGVLAPLAEMAHRLGVAIISIMHFNKGSMQTSTKVMHRFMASIAFVAAARVGFAAVRDPDDDQRHLFLHAKNNLAEPAPGLAYRIEQQFVTDMRIKTSRIVWEDGAVNITAEEAMAASKAHDAAPALEECKQFLAGIISRDGTDVKEIEKEAKAAGLSWATVRRAKDALKIKSSRTDFVGPWLWNMP